MITNIRSAGFTLIELVITLILMGILSAVVVTNISASTQHSVAVQADEFRRNLSHLQLLAISRGDRLKLVVTSGNNSAYAVCQASVATCDVNSALIDPTMDDPASGGRFSIGLTDGVQFTQPGPAGTYTYYFDSLGRPVLAATGTTLNPNTSTFKLNGVGRPADVTVTVLPITGFAQRSY